MRDSIHIFRSPKTLLLPVLAALALLVALPSAQAEPTPATGPTGEFSTLSADASTEASAKKKAKKKSRAYSGPPRFSLGATGIYSYRGDRYILPRTLIEVRGSVAADLGDQIVTVVIKRKGRTIKTDRVRLTTRGGKSSFDFKYRPKKKGRYVFTVELSDAQKQLVSAGNGMSVTAVRTNIRRGNKGVAVRVFQAKLAALNYVVPRNGKYNEATARAFMAFRKNNFLSRNFTAGSKVAKKLAAGKGGFRLRYPKAGRHVEISLKRQVMALADHGKVQRVYHISSGAPSTPTIRGTYHVYRKDWGTNAKGMVHSAYFIRGYAIHGFASVPNYNASHGCIRVPVPNAASIFNWINMGTRIDTYY